MGNNMTCATATRWEGGLQKREAMLAVISEAVKSDQSLGRKMKNHIYDYTWIDSDNMAP